VVFQTTTGELYAVPSPTEGTALNKALMAAPIRSMRIDSVAADNFLGLAVDRAVLTFPTCFARGTRIATGRGLVRIETLSPGDLVMTADHGLQPLRWIGHRGHGVAEGLLNPALRPVVLRRGSLGRGLPKRDLMLSQQHRVLVASDITRRAGDGPGVLLAARHLIGAPGIALAVGVRPVEYWHLLFDRHEVIFAEGAPTESLYAGAQALGALAPSHRAEILALFPHMAAAPPLPARPMLGGREARTLLGRHLDAARPLQRARVAA